MRLVTASLVGLLVATPLAAQQARAGERPREHVVKKGDTLWDLATHYFNNPFGWRSIYEVNTGVVEDPHWIYPTEVLIIPGLYDPEDPIPTTVAVRPMDRPARTIFYRGPVEPRPGEGPTVLVDEALEDLAVRPGEFHSAEFIAAPGQLQVLGRMIRPARAVDLMGHEVQSTAHPKDAVFMGYAGPARPDVGTRVMMVRVGRSVREAGREARVIHPTAVVQVLSHHDEVMQGQVIQQFETVKEDQLVVPLDLFPDFLGDAQPVEGADLGGRVLGFVTEQPLHGRADRGFLDVGARHGVKPGDVFVAYLPERREVARGFGETGVSEALPSEAVAELRILRVTGDHATFQVDRLVLPVLEDGIRVRRIRRMP